MSNGIVEKIVEKLSDKIKEVDDALIMDVMSVAQASDKLRAALAELDDHLDQRRFSDAAALGYSDISSNFIFLQRTLGALRASYNRKCSLVSSAEGLRGRRTVCGPHNGFCETKKQDRLTAHHSKLDSMHLKRYIVPSKVQCQD